MRKIHEAYEKLQNPWYRDWRYLVAIFSGFAVLGIAGFFGFTVISEKNREKTLDHIGEGFNRNDLSTVHRALSMARAQNPEDESLKVQYARLLSRIQPRAAVSVWGEVVKETQEPEYAVAFVLSAINVKDLETARRGVESLRNYQDAESAYRRAGFALAFAEGNDLEAFEHVEVLRNLEPDNIRYRIERARIGVRSSDDDLRERSVSYLWDVVDSEPGWRSDALKALALSHLDRREENELMGVLERARDVESGTLVRDLLWAVEAEQQMWGDVPEQTVRDVWLAAITTGELDVWLKLVSWMNTFGYSETVLDWGMERPSESIWSFPSGYLMAQSGLITRQPERVVAGLRDADWGSRDFLRLLMLSLLTERGTGRTFWLDQAYQEADASMRGGGRLLMPLLWEWGWLEAEVGVMARVLEKIPVAPAGLRGLFQRIEQAGDLALMYQLNRALLIQYPEQATLLNNAAYYATILGRDRDEALAWSHSVLERHPKQSEFLSTLALMHATDGNTEKAQEILNRLDKTEGLMARLVTSAQLGQDTQSWVEAIQAAQTLLQQEQTFVKKWAYSQGVSSPE